MMRARAKERMSDGGGDKKSGLARLPNPIAVENAVPPDVFMDAMARFCKAVGIKTKIIEDRIYLLNVQLVQLVAAKEMEQA
jgi:hypothetical protein